MMFRQFTGSIALSTLLLSGVAQARDESRYPRENFSDAGEYANTYRGSAGITPFIVNLNLDPTFSEAEKAVLREAMRVFVERAGQPHVISCAFAGATKDLASSQARFEQQLVEALMLRIRNDLWYPGNAYIARFFEDDDTVGLGYVGLFYDRTHPLPGYPDRHYLHIALNSDHLGPDSDYKWANDVNYWAGVIGHEFLHNLGYRHPTGYAGSFIDVYGDCVWTNGASGAMSDGLGDREIEKDR